MGKLYIVGTPLGNLGDFSPRAQETLRSVDFICAEDTRVTNVLLLKFEIKKPMLSYNKNNAVQRLNEILPRLIAGESCALVSDAGMPCISDPGELLVKKCAANGIDVTVVPSGTALTSALAVSGLPSKRFCFEGFLSVSKSIRSERLEQLAQLPQTLIFYEAPHKLKNTLNDLLRFLGDRNICICREMTKIHEEIIRGTISDMIEIYGAREPKGEYVLVVEGKPFSKEPEISIDEAANIALSLMRSGMKLSDACRDTAKQTGFSKSEIYRRIVGK